MTTIPIPLSHMSRTFLCVTRAPENRGKGLIRGTIRGSTKNGPGVICAVVGATADSRGLTAGLERLMSTILPARSDSPREVLG